MKVLKFGGTSVATVQSLTLVKQIVSNCQNPVVVVVSALGGVTNMLIKATQLACDPSCISISTYGPILELIGNIAARHHEIIDSQLIADEDKIPLSLKVDSALDNFKFLLNEIAKQKVCNAEQLDEAVSYGERLSSIIIGRILNAEVIYSPDFIETCNHVANLAACERHVKNVVDNHKGFSVLVAPGFISTDSATHKISNLGRGGSDFTAAIIASAIQAESLEIWTDVDGFMTANPREVTQATVIEHLSYDEAALLCANGAKVVYYPTIAPVQHAGIPTWVKNTFNSTVVGTVIDAIANEPCIVGVSSTTDGNFATIAVVASNNGLTDSIAQFLSTSLQNRGIAVFETQQEHDFMTFKVSESDRVDALNTLHNLAFPKS